MLAAVLAGGALAATAAAKTAETVEVRAEGGKATRAYAPSLELTLAVPPGYAPATQEGTWAGPAYRFAGEQATAGSLAATWSVAFQKARGVVGDVTRRGLKRTWPIEEGGLVFVPHRVAGRNVGSIPAGYVVATAPTGTGHEVAVVLRLGKRADALIRFEFAAPEGAATVESGDEVGAWNLEHALLALDGVELVGALPPRRVTAAARVGRGPVRGKVMDAFGHPVAGARATLQRRVAGRWIAVRAAKAARNGAYVLRRAAPGTYRVVGRLGGAQAASKPFAIRG